MLMLLFRNSNEYFEIVFVGNYLLLIYMKELVDYLVDKDFFVNVIFKFGIIIELVVVFRLFK